MKCMKGCKSLKTVLAMLACLLGFVAMIGFWVAADGLFLGMDQDQLFSSAVMLFLFSLVQTFVSCGCAGGSCSSKKKK